MKGARGMVLRLSLADLWHEWILSVCLIMAVAAVLSPLLILFGIKFGTIEIMRERLIEDPRNREIRPMISRSFERDWFEGMASRPDVDFVVPFTRQISAQVDALLQGGTEHLALDILPTAQDDPLLQQNGAPVPGEGECVLSASAAEALGAQPGSVLVVAAKRLKGSRYEKAETELRVAGVARSRATVLKSLYVPLPFLEAVERFKDGQAVPEYGWPGDQALAYPVYDGLTVVLPEPLSKVDEFRLVNNTGFSQKELLAPDALAGRLGWSMEAEESVYLASSKRKPVDRESLLAVEYALRGRNPVLVPWVRDLRAELLGPDPASSGNGTLAEDAGGKENPGRVVLAELGLDAFSLSSENTERLHPSVRPGWGVAGESASSADWRRVALPAALNLSQEFSLAGEPYVPNQGLSLRVTREDGTALEFPVAVDPVRVPGSARALVPARLAGVLNLFGERNVGFDALTGEFTLARRGYAGFRLYAATIDDVDGLRRELEAQGVTVSTEAERIRDVMELDGYLTLIFLLIAGVALVGGAASLTASLYASVERKRRDLSVLRLLGLSGPTLFRFPVYQGALIAVAGFGVAFSFFEIMAVVINTLFHEHLQAEESLCRLEPWHLGAALAGTVLIAVAAGSVAAWRVTRIEPAEALRDE
ncbi:MAG: ABC transporter permease [Desulfovibrio sp.]